MSLDARGEIWPETPLWEASGFEATGVDELIQGAAGPSESPRAADI